MGLSAEAATLLQRIRRAQTEHRTINGRAEEITLAEAYRIQEALGQGRAFRGYKLAFVIPSGQDREGSKVPVYGRIYPDMLLENPVQLESFRQARLEPGLAAVVGEDVPPNAEPDAAYLAVDGVFLATSFSDSVWESSELGVTDAVADNALGGGLLLGENFLDIPFEGALRLYLDGDLLTEIRIEALDDLHKRLAWLAKEVGGLRAEELVFFGSSPGSEARPGTLELRGPEGSALVARVEGRQER